MRKNKKVIYADDLIHALCEDVEIDGAHFARVMRHINAAPAVDAVFLPCKLGDTVYFPVEDYHDSAIIDGISITEQGMFFNWVQYEFGVDITECWDDGQFDVDEIGKTVFLTREEAEQALAKMNGGNEDG